MDKHNKNFVIVDLDNCIADDAWRIPKIRWQHADPTLRYNDYHSLALLDEIKNKDVLLNHHANGHDIVVFTARPTAFSEATMAWLDKHGVKFSALLMRNNNDHSKSVDLKRKQLDWLTTHYGYSLEHCKAAYDDRQDVVDMYREVGIKGFQLKVHSLDAYNAPKADNPSADEEGFVPLGLVQSIFRIAQLAATLRQSAEGLQQATEQQPQDKNAADILANMAETFRERNKVYGDNYKRVGAVMMALFPDGVQLRSEEEFNRWHLFELQIVKLTRFANSGLTHQDSIHDASVYGAMVESLLGIHADKIGAQAAD